MIVIGFGVLFLGKGNFRFLLAAIDFLVAYIIYRLIRNRE